MCTIAMARAARGGGVPSARMASSSLSFQSSTTSDRFTVSSTVSDPAGSSASRTRSAFSP